MASKGRRNKRFDNVVKKGIGLEVKKREQAMRAAVETISNEHAHMREAIHRGMIANESVDFNLSPETKIRFERTGASIWHNDVMLVKLETVEKGIMMAEIFGAWGSSMMAMFLNVRDCNCNKCNSDEGH